MWQILLTQLLIPELARVLADRHAAGLPPLTAAEILALLQAKTQAVITEGEAFLLLKLGPPPTPPPTPAPNP